MSLKSRNAELESSASALQKRLNDVLKELEAERRGFRHCLAEKDSEIRSMEDRIKDYNALREIKNGLDREIAMYNKMLDWEQSRLGLSPTGTPLSTPAGTNCIKIGLPGKLILRKRKGLPDDLFS